MAKSPDPETRKLGGAIREAALHVQNHVKEILRQLRPVSGLDFGLEPAIADLIAFWSHRHPDIRFERKIARGAGLDRRAKTPPIASCRKASATRCATATRAASGSQRRKKTAFTLSCRG